jgi:hypothetical protein
MRDADLDDHLFSVDNVTIEEDQQPRRAAQRRVRHRPAARPTAMSKAATTDLFQDHQHPPVKDITVSMPAQDNQRGQVWHQHAANFEDVHVSNCQIRDTKNGISFRGRWAIFKTPARINGQRARRSSLTGARLKTFRPATRAEVGVIRTC